MDKKYMFWGCLIATLAMTSLVSCYSSYTLSTDTTADSSVTVSADTKDSLPPEESTHETDPATDTASGTGTREPTDISDTTAPNVPDDTTAPASDSPSSGSTSTAGQGQTTNSQKPPVTTNPPVTTKPSVTTAPPVTTKPPVTTSPPVTTDPPVTDVSYPDSDPAPAITRYSAAAQNAYNTYAERASVVMERYYSKPMNAEEPWVLSSTALTKLSLKRDVAEANSLLRDLCTTYPANTTNTFDSYFCMDLMLRCYLQYGNLLESSTKAALENYFLNFISLNSSLEKAKDIPKSTSYTVYDSENHHIVQRTAYYLGSQILIDAGKGSTTLKNGGTVKEHHDAWETYLKAYLSNRGKYGVNIESGSPTYFKYTVGALLSLYDFSRDADLRKLCQSTLDVMMAETILQTADNSRGGATTRNYKKSAASPLGAAEHYMAIFFGRNFDTFRTITFHPCLLSSALTTYRPATYLYDLATADLTATPYTFSMYMPSAGKREYLGDSRFRYTFYPQKQQAFSTTYVCSDYVVGTITEDRRVGSAQYTELFQQNKCMSVIFSGNYVSNMDTRVYFVGASENTTGYNEIDGIGSDGAMIVAHCSEALDTNQFIMYASSSLAFQEKNGWMVAKESQTGAYIAIYSVGGMPSKTTSSISAVANGFGTLYAFNDSYKVAVVQCAPHNAYASLDAFAAALPAVSFSNNTVTYTNLAGTKMTYDISRKSLPTCNGTAVSFTPTYLYKSPYLNSAYGSGVVTVTDTSGKSYAIRF